MYTIEKEPMQVNVDFHCGSSFEIKFDNLKQSPIISK